MCVPREFLRLRLSRRRRDRRCWNLMYVNSMRNVPLSGFLGIAGMEERNVLSDTFLSPTPPSIGTIPAFWGYFDIILASSFERERVLLRIVKDREPHIRSIHSPVRSSSLSQVA